MILFIIRFSDRSMRYFESRSFTECVLALEKYDLVQDVLSIEVVPAKRID